MIQSQDLVKMVGWTRAEDDGNVEEGLSVEAGRLEKREKLYVQVRLVGCIPYRAFTVPLPCLWLDVSTQDDRHTPQIPNFGPYQY